MLLEVRIVLTFQRGTGEPLGRWQNLSLHLHQVACIHMEKPIQLDLQITCQLHLNYILVKFPSSPKILILCSWKENLLWKPGHLANTATSRK